MVEVLLLAPYSGRQLRFEVDREPAEARDPVGQVDGQDDGWKPKVRKDEKRSNDKNPNVKRSLD